MARIPLDLTRQDFRRGHRYNPRSCMIERGLERTRGGKWAVGADVRQRGVMWPRILRLEDDAERAMDQFDHGASLNEIFGSRRVIRVHLRGRPLSQKQVRGRPRSRPVSRPRAIALSTAAIGSAVLIGDGLAWVLITVLSLAVAAAAAVRVRRQRSIRTGTMQPPAATVPQADHVIPRASGLEPVRSWSRWPEPTGMDRLDPAPVRSRSRWPEPEPERHTETRSALWHESDQYPGSEPVRVPELAPPVPVPGSPEPAVPSWPDSPVTDGTPWQVRGG